MILTNASFSVPKFPTTSTVLSTQIATVPARKRGQTETDLAKEFLTPQSQRRLPDALLDARVGRSTLAGSLNDQVRFRVDRQGDDPSAWSIVADSPTAAALMQTKSGSELLRQLRTAVSSTGHLSEVSNLKGFILPKDNEGVLSGLVLSGLDDPTDPDARQLAQAGKQADPQSAGKIMRRWGDGLSQHIARAGAWNSSGWITFMPDTSRAMLTQAGAYSPSKDNEPNLREAKRWTTYIAGNASHEVQHSVSTPPPSAYRGVAKWIEEGTANVFSRTPTFLEKNKRSAGIKPETYAARLAHKPSIDLGWSAWKRPSLPPSKAKDFDKEKQRNYSSSQDVLRDLVHLAGGDFRSNEGKKVAFELLQRKSMRFTPGVLAKAIIERHGLDESVYDRLRDRIKTAVDIKGGAASIAKEFGINTQ